jgi:hypothetical protein
MRLSLRRGFTVAAAVFLLTTFSGTDLADAKPPRWTEHAAENALLSRANISYADCLPLSPDGRRFQCLIEYTNGNDRFLVLIPQRDGFAVRNYQPA